MATLPHVRFIWARSTCTRLWLPGALGSEGAEEEGVEGGDEGGVLPVQGAAQPAHLGVGLAGHAVPVSGGGGFWVDYVDRVARFWGYARTIT